MGEFVWILTWSVAPGGKHRDPNITKSPTVFPSRVGDDPATSKARLESAKAVTLRNMIANNEELYGQGWISHIGLFVSEVSPSISECPVTYLPILLYLARAEFIFLFHHRYHQSSSSYFFFAWTNEHFFLLRGHKKKLCPSVPSGPSCVPAVSSIPTPGRLRSLRLLESNGSYRSFHLVYGTYKYMLNEWSFIFRLSQEKKH